MVFDTKGMIDTTHGTVDRRIFTDQEIYQQELEKIFGRAWLCIGHESLVPNPNDFFLTYMGEDPVILTRDANGQLHAFLNMCRHRGNRVARADDGNAKNFMCTYHGWTYSNEGKLVSVPGLQEAYYGELDADKLGLVEVAQLSNFAGLVFATWDPEAPPFSDYVGDFGYYLQKMFNHRDAGVTLIGPQKWIVPGNWKLPTDNFAGDAYHFPLTHKSTLTAISKAFGTPPMDMQRFYADPAMWTNDPGNGHGVIVEWSPDEARRAEFQGVTPRLFDYYREIQPELARRLGETRSYMGFVIGSIFPNMSVHPNSSIRIYHPRGPLANELWNFLIVDNDAPEDVKTIWRTQAVRFFGFSGMFEQDDMDNWGQSTNSGLGIIGKRYPQLIQMGMGHEMERPPMPGKTTPGSVNEISQRSIYARWQEFMDARSWKDISITPGTAKHEGTVAS